MATRGHGISTVAPAAEHEEAEGTGPEYDYPTTEKDEPIPVVKEGEEVPLGGEGTEPVVGEDDRELTDAEIAAEEKLESRDAGEWSEDMAQNEPLPGEEEETIPEDFETLPSDRG
ncbi:unnamed protein product [Sphagnum compactum]